MTFFVERVSNYIGDTPPCNGAQCVSPSDEDNCVRGFWTIEINDMAHLMEFINEYGKCVVMKDYHNRSVLQIYDAWRE